MVNQTRKAKELSMEILQKFTKRYRVTKSGSKKEVALRLWKLEKHTMLKDDLKMIEDFLKLTPSKRYKGPRYATRKNGRLYCASGPC